MTKTCGTCKYWKPVRRSELDLCKAPVPNHIHSRHGKEAAGWTTMSRDATDCPCYVDADPPRRQVSFELLGQLMKWGPNHFGPLRDELSDALGVVDAVHEWRYDTEADEAKLMRDILGAYDEYEAGQ